MTTYIVTGRNRSGTSMMMAALDTSITLNAIVSAQADAAIAAAAIDPLYDPNPGGHYVPDPYTDLTSLTADSLIKVPLAGWLPGYIAPGNYKTILMVRNIDEVVISMERAFGTELDDNTLAGWDTATGALMARADANVLWVNYLDVINDPLGQFTRIAAAGWPIDPATAAATVDPALYRNRY